MTKLRVLLANMPWILTEILRELLDRQPDISVVGAVRTAELPSAVDAHGAEALIVSAPRGTTNPVRDVLRQRHPTLTLLELVPADDRAYLWSPGAAATPIELSADGILAALRGRPPQRGPRDARGGRPAQHLN